MPANRTFEVKALSRVEGEGALYVKLNGDQVEHVELNIYEPPRFFESFLRGRAIHEVPDITARICGICPVAYQMTSCHALEKALGITVTPEIRTLRRLLYCGEWIESHALHMYLASRSGFPGLRKWHQHGRRSSRGGRKGVANEEDRQRDIGNSRRPGDSSDQRDRRRLLSRARVVTRSSGYYPISNGVSPQRSKRSNSFRRLTSQTSN